MKTREKKHNKKERKKIGAKCPHPFHFHIQIDPGQKQNDYK